MTSWFGFPHFVSPRDVVHQGKSQSSSPYNTPMPEIPELEALVTVLNHNVSNQKVVGAAVRIPVVVRWPPQEEFAHLLTGNVLHRARRKAKFVVLEFQTDHLLITHLMLTGRLQLAEAAQPAPKRTGWSLAFEGGKELRYFDQKMDGKTYLVHSSETKLVPHFDLSSPDALDPTLTFELFAKRIRRFPGQIKHTLVNDAFITGIGNAYADEILFEAGVYPFARLRSIDEVHLHALYTAMHTVYDWAVPLVAARMGPTIDEKVRDFLKVHRKGGQPCPNCGTPLTEIAPNQRITTYCRRCQDWGQTGLLGNNP